MRFRPFCRTIAASLAVAMIVPTLYGAMPVSPSATDTCASCHQLDPLFSHPVNVRPSMAVPANLPLTDGRVACLTCHAIAGPDHVGAVSLRLPAEKLCASCHQNTPLTARLRHGANIRRAHLSPSSADAAGVAGLDAESRNCMSCHDGSIAGDAGTIRGIDPQSEVDHPVGNVYGRPMKESALAPSVMLDPRIRLMDGKVGCGSCHSPYSTQKSQLVKSNLGAALCLSCHQM